MKTEDALKLLKRGGLRITSNGNLYRVFRTKYGITFIENKQVYRVYEPFIGNQRQTTEFYGPDEVERYIEEKYHEKRRF